MTNHFYYPNLVRIVLLLGFASLLVGWAGVCFAEDSGNIQTVEFDKKSYYFDYKEVDTGGNFLDSETGWLEGLHFVYKKQNPDTKKYWQIICEQTNSDTKYDGSLQDLRTGATQPYQSTTANKIASYEFTFANPVPEFENTYVFIGIGYRCWDRNMSGPYGYLEKYSWFYIPVGYRREYRLNSNWEAAVDVTAKIMFYGQMKSIMTGYDSQQFDLGNEPGLKINLPFTYHITSHMAATIIPWYEYSGIGQSNSVLLTQNGVPINYFVEPDSTTNQYGIDFGVKFRF